MARPFDWQAFAATVLPTLPPNRQGNAVLTLETMQRLGYAEEERGDFALLAGYHAEVLTEAGYFAIGQPSRGAIVVHLHHRCGYAIETLRPGAGDGAGACTWREYGRAAADRAIFAQWAGGNLQGAVLDLLDASADGEVPVDHPEARAGFMDRLMEVAAQPQPRSVRHAVAVIQAAARQAQPQAQAAVL